MALLRNREVSIMSKTDGQDDSPVYVVMYKAGTRENAKLTELQLTEEEYKDFMKQHGELAMTNVNKIDNKSLQEIRDSQDANKIEESRKAQPTASMSVPTEAPAPKETK